jgi:hypothetical protein
LRFCPEFDSLKKRFSGRNRLAKGCSFRLGTIPQPSGYPFGSQLSITSQSARACRCLGHVQFPVSVAGNATAHSHHPPAPALPPHRNQRVLAAVHRNTNLCYIYSRRRSAPPWAATAQLRHASSPSPWPAADLTGGSNRVSAPRMNVRRILELIRTSLKSGMY